MRALITRPREDAEELAQELRRRGLIPVLAPLLTIRNRAGVVPQLDGVQALLLTSANGARALAAA
ncbi:MAG: uroporphyrinogen-III synthase, partial [Alphaproteobacteria bacterium]|nr:uroporphyrinogen-III synthase [Alphaproteobacteria bacterium]